MVWREIGDDADRRPDPWRVVELKRRHLERQPIRLHLTQRDFGNGRPDVPGVHGIAAKRA